MLGGGLEDIPMQGDREPLRPKVRREPANFHRSAEFPHRPPGAGWLPWVPSALQRKPSDREAISVSKMTFDGIGTGEGAGSLAPRPTPPGW